MFCNASQERLLSSQKIFFSSQRIFSFSLRERSENNKSFKLKDSIAISYDNAREKTNVDNLFYVAPTQTNTKPDKAVCNEYENKIVTLFENLPMIPFVSQRNRKEGKTERGEM